MNGMMLNPMMLQAGGATPATPLAAGAVPAALTSGASLLFASLLSTNNVPSLAPLPEATADQQDGQQFLGGLLNIVEAPQATDIPQVANPAPTQAITDIVEVTGEAEIYTLTTALAPAAVVEAIDATANNETSKPVPQGLFGSRENISEQPIQNLMARVPAAYNSATAAQEQQVHQPQADVQKLPAQASEQAKAVITLLQSGTALPTLPANANADNKDKNPLLAVAQKVMNTSDALTETQKVVQADTSMKPSDQPLSSQTKDVLASFTSPNNAMQNDNAPVQNINSTITPNTPAPAHHPILSTPGGGQEFTSQPVAIDQVHVKIAQAVKSGESRIELQLEPAHLGKIQVHIDLTGGRANITVLAEKSETLDLLKNDAGSLQKSLADAGIKADAGSLQFAQRENTFGFTNQFGGHHYEYTQANVNAPANDETVTNPAYRLYESDRALDILA